MKKFLILLLALTLVLSLCACGTEDLKDSQPESTGNVSNETQNNTEDTANIGETQQTTEDPVAAQIDLAKSCIDQPVSELYALIGEPQSSDYAPSCLGDGEDGMLYYDGFVVYTYREGTVETVYDVE